MTTMKTTSTEEIENPKHQEFIENHNHCALCGTILELVHVVDAAGCEIKEEAHCPECEIRTRAKIHRLN